jgi:acyl-CoA hydrolase
MAHRERFWLGTPPGPPPEPADITRPKTIAESAVTTSRPATLLDANGHGNVHGGVIMRWIDETAAMVAVKHCRRPVVTARIDRLDFIAPAYLGHLIIIKASLNYVGRSSMQIEALVTAEDPMSGDVHKVCSSELVFVALGEDKRPAAVPPLVPANEEEHQRIERARLRRERLKRIEEEMAKGE